MRGDDRGRYEIKRGKAERKRRRGEKMRVDE